MLDAFFALRLRMHDPQPWLDTLTRRELTAQMRRLGRVLDAEREQHEQAAARPPGGKRASPGRWG